MLYLALCWLSCCRSGRQICGGYSRCSGCCWCIASTRFARSDRLLSAISTACRHSTTLDCTGKRIGMHHARCRGNGRRSWHYHLICSTNGSQVWCRSTVMRCHGNHLLVRFGIWIHGRHGGSGGSVFCRFGNFGQQFESPLGLFDDVCLFLKRHQGCRSSHGWCCSHYGCCGCRCRCRSDGY